MATLDVDGLPILLFLPRAFPILPIRSVKYRCLLTMFPNFTDVTHYDFDICPPFFIVLVQGKDLLLRIAGP